MSRLTEQTLDSQRELHARRNALPGLGNGFHYCSCGANTIIASEEQTCVVCQAWTLDDIRYLLRS